MGVCLVVVPVIDDAGGQALQPDDDSHCYFNSVICVWKSCKTQEFCLKL